jgi:hypothetical protein
MEAGMFDKSYVFFTEADAIELAHMYKVAVEEGFAFNQGALELGIGPAEIRRLYDKAVKFVEAPGSLQQAHVDSLINKPGMPRMPKKHTWGSNSI